MYFPATAERTFAKPGAFRPASRLLLLFSLVFIVSGAGQSLSAQDIENASSAFVLRVRENKKSFISPASPAPAAKSKAGVKGKNNAPPRAAASSAKTGKSNQAPKAGARTAAPKTISRGIMNVHGNLPVPEYPAAARAVAATGAVNVQVVVDENGDVVSASAVSGHPLLRQAAEKAALQAQFEPLTLKGQPVKVTGIIVYNFVK